MLKTRFFLMAVFVVLSVFLIGCSSNGKLEVVDFNYPPSYNVLTGRVITMSMYVKNIGEKDCTINRIYSRQFWDQENPGLSGMYSKSLNLVLSPNQEYKIDLEPYLWDSDVVQSKEKKFTMVIEVEDPKDCVLEESSLEGTMNIEITSSPVQSGVGNSVVYDKRP
jgi:hypothetical protein